MSETTTIAERVQAVAKARGLKTASTTIRGLVRAVRSHPPVRYEVRRPSPSRYADRVTASKLAMDLEDWEGRASVRTIGYRPLELALASARGYDDRELKGDAVPNSYGYRAYCSVARSMRIGRWVLVGFARVQARSCSHGRGSTPANCDYDYVVRTGDLLAPFARLPQGWSTGVDGAGFFLTTGVADEEYHPAGWEIAEAIADGNCHEIVRRAIDAIRSRRASAARERYRTAEALREHASVTVCLADSKAAGNCEAGSRSWSDSHLAGRTEATVGELLDADPTNPRVIAACAAAVARCLS